MNIINLTPHTITETITAQSFAPSGQVARIRQSSELTDTINGIMVYTTTYGAVEGLPEPEEGIIYIVSAMCLAGVEGRTDVVAPGNLLRDENGQPIGCQGFRSK